MENTFESVTIKIFSESHVINSMTMMEWMRLNKYILYNQRRKLTAFWFD